MFNQMFSAKNFRDIFDSENRKGVDIGSRFFPDLEPFTKALLNKRKDIRQLYGQRASLSPTTFDAQRRKLYDELRHVKQQRSNEIDTRMEQISEAVRKPGFSLTLKKVVGLKGKSLYTLGSGAEPFFVSKQLQKNVSQIYDVKQGSRTSLVSQLQTTLSTKFPLEIVRTDIADFYESIDRKRLVDMLGNDPLLSASSKKFIVQILSSYGMISSSAVGIPRGVGISAYLAEMYLRSLDDTIRKIPGLVLYCRYVDDLVTVFARPPAGEAPASYFKEVLSALDAQGLIPNLKKTQTFELASLGSKSLTYLGYRFLLESGKCLIWPSAAKIRKYKKRLDCAFDEYRQLSHINSRRAHRDLVARVKFLTGNTRLTNSKGAAATGVYYANSMVTELSSFELLDKRLKRLVASIKRPSLRKRLKSYTYTDGFKKRRYHNFSTHEMHSIVRAWSNV